MPRIVQCTLMWLNVCDVNCELIRTEYHMPSLL